MPDPKPPHTPRIPGSANSADSAETAGLEGHIPTKAIVVLLLLAGIYPPFVVVTGSVSFLITYVTLLSGKGPWLPVLVGIFVILLASWGVPLTLRRSGFPHGTRAGVVLVGVTILGCVQTFFLSFRVDLSVYALSALYVPIVLTVTALFWTRGFTSTHPAWNGWGRRPRWWRPR